MKHNKILIVVLGLVLVVVSGCSNTELLPTNAQITIPEGAHITITSTTTMIENGSQTIIDIINKGQEAKIELKR